MSKQQTLQTLAGILTNNVGNKLTIELANGIVFGLAQNIPDDPVPEVKVGADGQTEAE